MTTPFQEAPGPTPSAVPPGMEVPTTPAENAGQAATLEAQKPIRGTTISFRAATPEEIAAGEAAKVKVEPRKTRGKTPRSMIVEDGVWKPFQLWPRREKVSDARQRFTEASIRVDELQLEAERTEASLEFLRKQVADAEQRLTALSIARSRAAAEASQLLLAMTSR